MREIMYTNCWSKNMKGRDHLEELGIDGILISAWILNCNTLL
jgi:hypothetical protein